MELRYTRRDLDPAARAFFDRLAAGEFCVSRCLECDHRTFPPREFCPACGARGFALEPHPGSGALYAFTTQERGFRFTAPDVLGLVELDGGAGYAFGVIRGAYDDLTIGDRLVLDPVTVEESWVLPAWRRAHEAVAADTAAG